jgi:hypothetical protein
MQQQRQPSAAGFRREHTAMDLDPLAVIESQVREFERPGRRQGRRAKNHQLGVFQRVCAAGFARDLDQISLCRLNGEIVRVKVERLAPVVKIQLVPSGVMADHNPFDAHRQSGRRLFRRQILQLTERDDLIRRGGLAAGAAGGRQPNSPNHNNISPPSHRSARFGHGFGSSALLKNDPFCVISGAPLSAGRESPSHRGI